MSKWIERLYVIGAGASAAAPYRLPTLKALTWELARTFSKSNRRLFERAVYECFGVRLGRKQYVDFEELLNRLDPSPFTYLAGLPVGGIDALAHRVRRRALTGLRTFIRDRCRACSRVKGPYDRLVAALTADTAVVSFNWDVLLEMALRRAGRSFDYLPSTSATGATILLKPHGSTNWFALLDRELLSVDLNANVDVLGRNLSYYLLYLKNPIGRLDLGSSSPFVKAALAPVPAIVPPGATRLLFVGGVPRDGFVDAGHAQAMKAIWAAFFEVMQSARELVVVGYSLPGTDAAAIEMFRYWAGLPGRRRVILIDRDPKVAARYKAILKAPVRLVGRDFAKFEPGLLD
jgi:hypothetical protein